WMASVTYLGNRTNHIWSGYELNPAIYIPGQSTTGNTNQRRLLNLMNPSQGQYYGSLATTDYGNGRYNGILLGLQKRLARGWRMNVNSTGSKCRNNAEPGTDITNNYPEPLDRTTNWGPCAADRPHLFNGAFILQSSGAGSGAVRTITNGWQFGAIVQARSGAPLTPST